MRERLGNPPVIALTATATPEVQGDIRAALKMDDPVLFHTGIDRPNLCVSVRDITHAEDKTERLLDTLGRTGGPAIVYTALIRDLLALEESLQRRGITPLVYHGKLSAHERREQQRLFLASKDAVILATNAFGMGVDKPDIRAIVHWQIPRTLEAYYQEIGRAGRDGNGSLCELLWFEEDLAIQRNFTEWANPNRDFMMQVVMFLSGLGERVATVDVQDLRATFLLKNRHDGRVETCLRLLRTAGCTAGDLGRDFEWLRTPDADEIATWLPEDKRERDLRGLLAMVQYAGQPDGCRKATLHAHFGLPAPLEDAERPDAGCGACDLCAVRNDWIATHIDESTKRSIAATDTENKKGKNAKRAAATVTRGDWINIRGAGLCAVRRVHVDRSGKIRVDVERARDLSEGSYDLSRVKWRPVTQ